jgi:hypothetical protein
MYYWTRLALTCVVGSMLLINCGPKRRVTREKPGTGRELSGNWSAVDAKETSGVMIKDCFAGAWLMNFVEETGNKPAMRVRKFINKTDEHIDANVFVKSLEKAMVNSGKVTVLAQAGAELAAVNAEEDYAVEGRVADGPAIGEQKGGDFVLTVYMTSILDQAGGEKVKFYKINAELINATSGAKVWIGDHEIQKYVEQAKASW